MLFPIFGKVKPNTENTRALYMVAITFMTVQVFKLPW
jgi:hypothetical protein